MWEREYNTKNVIIFYESPCIDAEKRYINSAARMHMEIGTQFMPRIWKRCERN